MKSQRDPRLVIALILLLVAVAFLGGTLRLIRSARAAGATPVMSANPTELNIVVIAGRGETHFAQELTPTEEETAPVKQDPTSLLSADTGGIIALAIVIVLTILLGALVGVRSTASKKASSR